MVSNAEFSGAPLRVRPIVPGDAAAYRGVLERISEEDRYCRFFHVVNHFDLSDIARFVDPASDSTGFIAEGDGRALGFAHLFEIAPQEAELAVVVATEARHTGVGHALLERIVGAARERRCTMLTAYAFSLNGAFSQLARSIGMTPTAPADEVVTWTLALRAPVAAA